MLEFSFLQILCFDLAGVIGNFVFRFIVYLEALIDVLFSVCVSQFWKRVCSLRVVCLWLILRFFAFERRMSSLTFFRSSDVVNFLEGVILFGVVHFVSVSSTFSKRSAGSGIS